MSAVGARAASPVTALGETLSSVEALLAGRSVTADGRYVRLDDVALTFPPVSPPPLLAGVRVRIPVPHGATCDGVLLAEPASAPYIAWARALVVAAAAQAHRPEPEIAVYTWSCVDRDSQTARQRLSPVLEENLRDPGPVSTCMACRSRTSSRRAWTIRRARMIPRARAPAATCSSPSG